MVKNGLCHPNALSFDVYIVICLLDLYSKEASLSPWETAEMDVRMYRSLDLCPPTAPCHRSSRLLCSLQRNTSNSVVPAP